MKGWYAMKILERIAQNIVKVNRDILQYPISIADTEGYIIDASDKSRIGDFHPPSLEVVKKNDIVTCMNEINDQVLAGIALPINFNQNVIGVVGIVGNPKEVFKYGKLLKSQVEMMCQETFSKEMRELNEKMIEVFIHQIIHTKEKELDESIPQYSNLLQIDLKINRICLLIDIPDIPKKVSTEKESAGLLSSLPLQYVQREVLNYLKLIFIEDSNDLISALNIERFIILKALSHEESLPFFLESLNEKLEKLNSFLERKYGISARISVGHLSVGIKNIADSYQKAKKAMTIGMQVESQALIYVYNEREMLLDLLPKELSASYQQKLLKIISPLIEHVNYDVLSTTFMTYCQYDMKVSETSRNLFIHRNTLVYRLERIREITHLDPSSFKNCMLIYTAIRSYEEIKKQ